MLVMVGFALSCFGLLLFVWLAFGGAIPLKPEGYRFHVDFPEAVSLAQQADVRISGVPVGKVVEKQVGPGNTTDATIQLDRKYAPLPRDARAILRQKTLLGETYVELTPGTRRAGNYVADGGTLPPAHVAPTVQLDEIFRAFDAPTRAAFQTWMQSQASALRGRGTDINDILGNFGPFAQGASSLLTILNSQEGAVRRLVSNTGVVFSALGERDGQLRALIQSADTVFATTARRNQELAQAFVALPRFERESTLTFKRLDAFAADTNPLVTQLRPAARELSPTLQDIARLSPDLRLLFRDLGPLIDSSRAGLPALQRLLDDLRPLFSQLGPALAQLNPLFRYLAPYQRDISAFFSNVVASTEATDRPPKSSSPVHYLRTTNPISAENLAIYPRRLGSSRPNPYQLPNGFDALGKLGHLLVYDNRSCANGAQPAPPTASGIPGLVQLLQTVLFKNVAGGVLSALAPPCQLQPQFGAPFNSDYPQLRADATP
jgi:virulence factor Mce-like protein